MKAEVCYHCDNCGEDDVCARYGKPIAKVNACGVFGRRHFQKAFNRKGMKHKIEYRDANPSPLKLGREGK